MKPFTVIHDFTAEEIQIISKYRDEEKNARLKLRFAALLLLAFKTAPEVIALSAGHTVITIKNRYSQYVSEGIESLRSFKYRQKQSYLNFFSDKSNSNICNI